MVVFTVYGRIAGKGSRTVGVRKNGTRYTRPASKYEKPWVKAVGDAAIWRKAQGGALPEPPYAVYLDFYFARPKRPSHDYPSQLDLDKAIRATTDGLVEGGLLSDDRHVTEYHVRKFFAASDEGECCKIVVTVPDRAVVRAA